MPNQVCKGTTRSGNPCKLKPDSSGYCYIHNPENIAARAKDKEERDRKSARLLEVLNVVERTCQSKSWNYYVESCDRANWRYATVSVRRSVHIQYREEIITGEFDIHVEDGVRISPTKTSFYGYGLDELHHVIMVELGNLPWLESPEKKKPKRTNLDRLIDLLKRFHIVATQLRRRYNGRDTLVITDEYDVQDLLNALLKTIFDDVRPEEYSPSYAGASSRLDFLLKKEEIVVEVKMASRKLSDKKIGEQLIIDIERYKAHPDCKILVCFVYDPGHHIRNPVGLEKDLSGEAKVLNVVVLVVPV